MPKQVLPLITMPENRAGSTSQDAKLVNGYVEKISGNHVVVVKRPAFNVSLVTPGSGKGSGFFYYGNHIYAVRGTNFYQDGVLVGPVASAATNTNEKYSFTPVQSAPNETLFFHNSQFGYNYVPFTNTLSAAGGGYPATNAVYGCPTLDATTYVGFYTQAVNGSNLNDTTTWNALNVIQANASPDSLVALQKQVSYVVAFKENSTEVFYDAGNPSGSPLGRVDAARISKGCANANSVVDAEDKIYWLGRSSTGSFEVLVMSGLRVQPISTPPVDRWLYENYSTENQSGRQGTLSFGMRLQGHLFYGLTVSGSSYMVYSQESKTWAQWTLNQRLFGCSSVSQLYSGATNLLPWNSTSSIPILQDEFAGSIYSPDTLDYTVDNPVFEVVTPIFDGGTRAVKYLQRMDFMCDQDATGSLEVAWSDDDYKTWSQFRQVDLSQNRPSLWHCGSFRKRAFWIRYSAPTPLRIQAVELEILLGSN